MRIKLNHKYWPTILFSFFGILIFYIGIFNHYYFKTVTYDYGNYNFAFWDYSHFRISQLPTFRGTFLQDHFSLTLFYFIPVYWILNWLTHSYTLIIIQCSMILLAGWYSYLIIRLKTNNKYLGLGLIAYYFLLLGRYTTFSSDVNLAVISACFIPIFLYYFETKKYLVAAIILALSLLSRENIPIWFIFIFIVLIINHIRDKKAVWFSVVGIVVSLVYFIVLFKIIIPSVESADAPFALFNYSALGTNPGEAFSFILKHPIETIKLFFVNHTNDPAYDGLKLEFYWVYLVSGGFVLLYRPQYLIWFIPIVMQKVLNDVPVRWSIAIYYSIEVVTLLPISVFLILSGLKTKALQNTTMILVCVAALSMTIHKLDQKNCEVGWMMNPKKEKFYDKRFYKKPFDVKRVNRLLSSIPKEAKLSASNQLLPHLAQREKIYFFPNVQDAEYIVFSVFDDNYLHSPLKNENIRRQYLMDPGWKLLNFEYPVFLLKKAEQFETNECAFNQIIECRDTLFCDYENIDQKNNVVLFSSGEIAELTGNLSDSLAWKGSNSIWLTKKDSYSNPVQLNDINQIAFLELSAWSYTGKDEGHLVAAGSNGYFKVSYESDSIAPSGWRRLKMNLWIPKNKFDTFSIYFGNNGHAPAFFDDLQIVKHYFNKK